MMADCRNIHVLKGNTIRWKPGRPRKNKTRFKRNRHVVERSTRDQGSNYVSNASLCKICRQIWPFNGNTKLASVTWTKVHCQTAVQMSKSSQPRGPPRLPRTASCDRTFLQTSPSKQPPHTRNHFHSLITMSYERNNRYLKRWCR